MLKIFEDMFPEHFWNQCVLIFTHMGMSETEIPKRVRVKKKTDMEFAITYVKEVGKKLPYPSVGILRHLFIDAAFDKTNKVEKRELSRDNGYSL